MKKNNLYYIFSFLIALLVVSSGCIEEGGIHTTVGAGGGGVGGNITYNITYYGTMNQTPNMTAGPPGANGLDNMTAGPPGPPGTTDMSWNASYYLRDNSRTLTSEKMKRDVDNDLLTIYGGNTIAGGNGGIISLFGKDTANPFAVEMNAGDGGIGNIRVTGWVGGTTPHMDMNAYNISAVKDPVALQDAATKAYVDSRPSGGSTDVSWNITYLLLTQANTWFIANNSATLRVADNHIATNASATLLTADQHIATNMSTVSPAASLLAADLHIATNVTDIRNLMVINQTAVWNNMTAVNTSMRNNVSMFYTTTINDVIQDEAINTSMRNNVSMNFAPLVAGKVPTVNLGGAGADNTKYLRGDQTWAAPAGGSGMGYTLTVLSLAIAAPADFTTYSFGGVAKIPGAVGLQKMYFPKTGTIKAVEIFGYGTTAGTAEGWELSIVNATSTTNSTLIANVATSATTRRWSNTTLNAPATAGDYIEIKTVTPGWVTNPVAQVFSGSIYIE